jgi:hypothetical protein
MTTQLRVCFHVWVALAAVFGCQGAPEQSPRQSSGASPATPPVMNASTKFGLTPTMVGGQTNVDTSGLLAFDYSGSLTKSTTALVEAQSYFLDSKGAKVAAQVLAVAPKEPADTASLQLKASTPLEHDAWHWAVIEPNESLLVAGVESPDVWAVHFFTGSAPRPVTALGSSAKNPRILTIELSEPMDASTIEPSGLVKLGQKSASACVLRGGGCADRTQPFVTNSLDVQLNTDFAPVAVLIALSGSASGSGRTVAEGAAASGEAYFGGKLVVDVAASDWSTCSDADNSTYCWSDKKPLPVP